MGVAVKSDAAVSGPGAAQQADARLAAIVHCSDEAIASMTPDLVITTWNAGAERLFGYSEAEVVGRKTVMIPAELEEEFEEIMHQARSGRAMTYETRRLRKDGSFVDVAVALSAMRDPGGVLIGYSAVARDITDRLQAEVAAAQAARDRIARDLQDRVIGRIFRVGMTLQSVASRVGQPEVTAPIEAVIRELDISIKEIRGAIFGLHSHVPPQDTPGLRGRIVDLVGTMVEVLGFTPGIAFSGPVEEAASEDITAHLIAVVREALSNIARHAHASAAELSLRADDDLVLVVSDNGAELGEVTRRSGLRNMRQRAEALGGTFSVANRRGGGTQVEWHVPIGRPTR